MKLEVCSISFVKCYNPRENLDCGWHDATGAQVEVFEITGDHQLVKEPFVQELAQKLNSCLENSV